MFPPAHVLTRDLSLMDWCCRGLCHPTSLAECLAATVPSCRPSQPPGNAAYSNRKTCSRRASALPGRRFVVTKPLFAAVFGCFLANRGGESRFVFPAISLALVVTN